VASHDAGVNGAVAEHGPFAGAGFYQDLALAAGMARHAVIGTLKRSSTGLVLGLVQFYRTMEAWEASDDPRDWTLQQTMVDTCDAGLHLPRRPAPTPSKNTTSKTMGPRP
jgi:hypothetical protein